MPSPSNQELMDEIKLLKREIQDLKEICSRMNGHIDFVETVYDSLKAPISYISSRFSSKPPPRLT